MKRPLLCWYSLKKWKKEPSNYCQSFSQKILIFFYECTLILIIILRSYFFIEVVSSFHFPWGLNSTNCKGGRAFFFDLCKQQLNNKGPSSWFLYTEQFVCIRKGLLSWHLKSKLEDSKGAWKIALAMWKWPPQLFSSQYQIGSSKKFHTFYLVQRKTQFRRRT